MESINKKSVKKEKNIINLNYLNGGERGSGCGYCKEGSEKKKT